MSDLVDQIDALLALNAKGAVSHPVPGLAVELLERAKLALTFPAALSPGHPIQGEADSARSNKPWPGDSLDQLVSTLEAIEYLAHNDIKAPGMKSAWDFARYAQGLAVSVRSMIASQPPAPAGVREITDDEVERAAKVVASRAGSSVVWEEHEALARAVLEAAK